MTYIPLIISVMIGNAITILIVMGFDKYHSYKFKKKAGKGKIPY